jgi:glutamate---cysteine ligase / carboxylate-amine ligase
MNFEDMTIGVEEEYQLIDSETRELTSFVSDVIESGTIIFHDQVKPELLQSQVEIGSHVCRNIKEVRQELIRLRRGVSQIAKKENRKIVAAGTHPFSRWQDQAITEKERYRGLVADMQYLARRLLVFGMHVHIGIPNRELRMDILNQMVYFLPHFLSLSTSSPFWLGYNTGLKSYRSVVFEDLPRTGLPEYFESADDYDRFVTMLIQTNCIDEPTKIWWDIRPHPEFPTIEFRICDSTTRINEAVAIAGLMQAVVVKLIQLRRKNQTWRRYRHALIGENKWRAVRDGINGTLLDLGKEEEVPVHFLIEEILEMVDDVLDDLRIREDVEYVRTILKEGTSADRQLRKYEETDSLEEVVDMLAEETVMDC